jgi:hypothetical protein
MNQALVKKIVKLIKENRLMRRTLAHIAAWDLPEEKFEGRRVPYEPLYDSNGARDYIRTLATECLNECLNAGSK